MFIHFKKFIINLNNHCNLYSQARLSEDIEVKGMFSAVASYLDDSIELERK